MRCSGKNRTGKRKGERCENAGAPNYGSLFFCSHHFRCKGIAKGGRSCGSRAKYDGYCGAAHLPNYQVCKPEEFRGDTSGYRKTIIVNHEHKDAYTGAAMLRGANIEIDHVVECQVWTHLLNEVHRKARADKNNKCNLKVIHAVVEDVKELTNGTNNLVPVSRDVNQLKGAGITTFLDERTFSVASAILTSCLGRAHQFINTSDLDDKSAKLDEKVVKKIKKEICERLKYFQRKFSGGNHIKGLIAVEIAILRDQIQAEASDEEVSITTPFVRLRI
ncbi:hypothetical protein PHYPSEUDO_014669 [Phytophthora pseudosyringae]|uniref:Uncharacterized protein n=1 Tax=Phytophthora pseudosyringae TaxID=221518 RepID=A0A8T1W5M6_9STRA|nr:hypothetical protein PHYPSEUDO_014669 [Phytophthora pseudosyringae]